MAVIDGRTRLAHLSSNTCWELLASAGVGRIGVLVDSAPEIYPVNFVVDERSIVFRTDPGSKLRGLERSRRCASRWTGSTSRSTRVGASW